MDYLSMDARMKNKLKIKCETSDNDVTQIGQGVKKCPYEYFLFDHFNRYVEDAMEELENHKAINALLANREIVWLK